MEVNSENIEMWIMMLVDDELSEEETKAVWRFMEQHPEYMDIYTAFREVKIPAEETAYPDIHTLLKAEDDNAGAPPAAGRRIMFRYTGWAAAVILLIGAGWYGLRPAHESPDDSRMPIAHRDQTDTPYAGLPSGMKVAVAAEDTNNRNAEEVRGKQANVVVLARQRNVIDVSGKDPEPVVMVAEEEVSRIRPLIGQGKNAPAQLAAAEMHMLPAGTHGQSSEKRESMLPPIAASLEQKALLDDMSREMQEKVTFVKDAYQVVKNSTIQINIGNKSFIIKK